MVTMKDVAKELGLSITTVSRALGGYDDVAEATRARIQATALALNYHPNAAARSLQGRSSHALGLVIPPSFHHASDTFWLEFIGGAVSACGRRGFDLMLAATEGPGGTDEKLLQLTRSRRVDGMLICDVLRSDPRIALLQQHRLPFVAFGRTTGEQSYSFVDVDGAAGVTHLMEHLLSLGHRRIAYLGPDSAFSFSHYRMEGYRAALVQAALPYDPELVREGLAASAALQAAREVFALPARPTAVVGAADFLGLAALKAARMAGLTVPGDVSIATFDDNRAIQQALPPLTAVSQPNRLLGEQAAALLLDRIAHPDRPYAQRLVVPTLITRESTGPASDVAVVAGAAG